MELTPSSRAGFPITGLFDPRGAADAASRPSRNRKTGLLSSELVARTQIAQVRRPAEDGG